MQTGTRPTSSGRKTRQEGLQNQLLQLLHFSANVQQVWQGSVYLRYSLRALQVGHLIWVPPKGLSFALCIATFAGIAWLSPVFKIIEASGLVLRLIPLYAQPFPLGKTDVRTCGRPLGLGSGVDPSFTSLSAPQCTFHLYPFMHLPFWCSSLLLGHGVRCNFQPNL